MILGLIWEGPIITYSTEFTHRLGLSHFSLVIVNIEISNCVETLESETDL